MLILFWLSTSAWATNGTQHCESFPAHQLRVAFEYSLSMPSKYADYIRGISEAAAARLSEELDVINAPLLMKSRSELSIEEFALFTRMYPVELAADVLVFVDVGSCNEHVLAWASPRKTDACDRTTIGRVRFCDRGTESLIYEEDVKTMIHEILHLLGIRWHYLKDLTSLSEGPIEEPFLVRSPEVVKSLRLSFNCIHLIGMPAQDSHWLAPESIMNAYRNENQELYEITLAALEDTGHFKRRNAIKYHHTSCRNAPIRARYPEGEIPFERGIWKFAMVDLRNRKIPVVVFRQNDKDLTIPYLFDSNNFVIFLDKLENLGIYFNADTFQLQSVW